jgi:hypothetical protein
MKLRELKRIVDQYMEQNPERFGDCDVIIPTNLPSYGSMSSTPLRGANAGIDWESGKFILWPEDKLTIKPTNEKL